ncbi:hypothetical protein LCGC14_2223780 [marine sediment metagenome]|uniref:Uncharacterized protein n=1 Tax=marine sediment metagenome TaxID=412755 RepID=A0A0F9FMR9_9ZZZZ
MPFADFTDWDDCIRSAPAHVQDKEAYCGSIKHKVEDKLVKAVPRLVICIRRCAWRCCP